METITQQKLIDFGNWLLSTERRDLFESEFSYNEAMNRLDTVQDIDIKHFNNIVNLKPIELTDKLFRKLGFKKGLKGYWFKGGVEYNPKKQLLEGFGYCEIKYFHELQSLYYLLTKQELILKH